MVEDAVRRRILEAVEGKRDEVIGFLRRIVGVESILGGEGPAQKIMEEKFRSMGLELDIFEPDIEVLRKHPEYSAVQYSEEHGYKGRPNVVGRLKGSGGGRSIILTGHIDTVPVGPKELWRHDPLGGEVERGRIYGRGAACDKGGLTIATMAVESLLDAGVKLKGDLALVSNIEDEVGGTGGMLAIAVRGYKADGALYPHPNLGGLSGLLLACSGMLFFKVKVGGVMDEFPQGGVNAIGNMFKIYQGLIELDENRGRRVRHLMIERFFAAAGWPPASIRATNIIPAIIASGADPIQVPASCELKCSISYPPGEDPEKVKREVEDCVVRIAGADMWMKNNPPTLEWFGVKALPAQVDPSHPLIQLTKHYIKELKGVDAEDRGIPMFCDYRFLTNYADTPQVMFGPQAGLLHGFDEWVDVEDFITTIKIVALIVADWCGYKR